MIPYLRVNGASMPRERDARRAVAKATAPTPRRADPATTAGMWSVISGAKAMVNENERQIMGIYERLMKERSDIRARMQPINTPPAADTHASIAVLAGWADGMIDDDYVEGYMSNHKSCSRCVDNYDYYKALRKEHLAL